LTAIHKCQTHYAIVGSKHTFQIQSLECHVILPLSSELFLDCLTLHELPLGRTLIPGYSHNNGVNYEDAKDDTSTLHERLYTTLVGDDNAAV
jgi:hypothetical protein